MAIDCAVQLLGGFFDRLFVMGDIDGLDGSVGLLAENGVAFGAGGCAFIDDHSTREALAAIGGHWKRFRSGERSFEQALDRGLA